MGASVDAVAGAIYHRLGFMYPDLDVDFDVSDIENAVMEVAGFHSGCEELGSSDISIMVKEVLSKIGAVA